MLSISARGAASSAEKYYEHLNEKDDYYLAGNAPPAQWHGRAADELKLRGEIVRSDDFKNLLRGRGPHGHDLIQQAGDNHRAGWDLTFSAPKSVSAAWAITDDPATRGRIEQAHQRATDRAMQYIEDRAAQTRRGKGGATMADDQSRLQPVAGIIYSRHDHHLSREADPQLHSHCFVHNLALRQDGTFGALESREIYRHKMAAGAVYRAELADELQRMGFAIEADKDSFRLAAIPAAAEREFSQRRQQIEAALQGRAGTAQESEIAALASRKAKDHNLDHAKLFDSWRSRAATHGLTPEAITQAREQGAQSRPLSDQEIAAVSLESLSRNRSIFSARDISREIATRLQVEGGGVARMERIEQAMVRDRQIVCLAPDKFSTPEMVGIERKMMSDAQAMAGSRQHALDEKRIDRAIAEAEERKGIELSPEQRRAIHHVTGGPDIAAIQGAAGAGKSAALDAVRGAYEEKGYRLTGVALSGKASDELQKSSGIKSQTLHSFLDEIERGRRSITARDIVVVDEAAMIGSRQMQQLSSAVRAGGGKLILVGDTRQLQSIEAGSAFGAITKKIGASEVVEHRRQKSQWAREAADALRAGDAAQALRAYADRGKLSIHAHGLAAKEKMIADWAADSAANPDKSRMMLAGTRADVRELNEMARDWMRDAGKLEGAEHRVGDAHFAAGDRIMWLRNDRGLGVKNGQLGTIESISTKRGEIEVTARRDDGEMIQWRASDYEHIQHGYAATVHKSQGGTIDSTYILAGGPMDNLHSGYVGLTRHREEAKIYLDGRGIDDNEALAGLARDMSQAEQRESTVDFPEVEKEEEQDQDKEAEARLAKWRQPQLEHENEQEIER